jgi:hypothetical protein
MGHVLGALLVVGVVAWVGFFAWIGKKAQEEQRRLDRRHRFPHSRQSWR